MSHLRALAYIGLVGPWCVVEATMQLPTVVTSVAFLATPAVGLLLSNLLLGELLTLDLLAGSSLIMGGVALAASPARSGEHP